MRDSLYQDLTDNLDAIYDLWTAGDQKLRFIIPVLCAIKLEAFINVAGKLNIKSWEGLERRLGFKEKCEIICEIKNSEFNRNIEPNKSALAVFEIRNALVHPKMKTDEIDEYISQEEYEIRRNKLFVVDHHLRAELSAEKVKHLKKSADDFVQLWSTKLIPHSDYWLRGGSTGGFTLEEDKSG